MVSCGSQYERPRVGETIRSPSGTTERQPLGKSVSVDSRLAQLDARSDLYGLGATAFYAFLGRFPFEGKTATSVIAAVLKEEPAAVSTVQPLTPPAKVMVLPETE